MVAIVIADASPLIALARVDGLGWLQALFHEVLVTEAVLGEVLTGSFAASEACIEQAIAAGIRLRKPQLTSEDQKKLELVL